MPIVCNGFKDDEFIETVILATKLGAFIVPVVERFSDLELIVKHAQKYGVRPRIGIRVKPSARGSGKWESSSGPEQVRPLRRRDHEGLGVPEAARHGRLLHHAPLPHRKPGGRHPLPQGRGERAYPYLHRAPPDGGRPPDDQHRRGLGIDYDGSQSAWDSSVNYTVQEYAADVVYRLKSVCDEAKVPTPPS